MVADDAARYNAYTKELFFFSIRQIIEKKHDPRLINRMYYAAIREMLRHMWE